MREQPSDEVRLREPSVPADDAARADGDGAHLIDPGLLLNVITSTAEQGIFVHDGERVLASNSRVCELLDIPAQIAAPGAPLDMFIGYGERRGDYVGRSTLDINAMRAMIKRHEDYATERRVPSGRVLRVDSHHRNGLTVTTYTDVTEARHREQELRESRARNQKLANSDGLTGLTNRRAFDEVLAEEFAYGAASELGGTTIALLVFDLDRFKPINDIYGHATGDALLRKLAERFRAEVRDTDTIARIGGDEFAVLAKVPDEAHAIALGDRLRAAASTPVDVDGTELCVGASVGVAFAGPECATGDALLHAADLALYGAKARGRNVVVAFDPAMERASRERTELEGELRRALEREELTLHYQLQQNLRSRETVGYEALLRWCHPKRGIVGAADFIPMAEETGLIVSIGRWVLRKAASDFAGLDERLRVSVNVSPVQLAQSDVPRDVAEALELSGLDPKRLEIEVTEEVLIKDPKRTLQALDSLAAMGVTLSLDDFGSGYSSLAYLTMFPFSKIKIDRSFIDRMQLDPRSEALVSSILALAASLGLKVTAEGVETQDQLMKLANGSCDEAQGYLLGKPMPLSAVLAAAALANRGAPQDLSPAANDAVPLRILR